MLLTIVAIWAVVIPLAILGVSWQAARLREARASLAEGRPAPRPTSQAGSLPACARRAARPRRTVTRRVCPEHPRGAGRRPASA
jgi:hypothetical protein